uniref:LAGLIDADG homing endonuclease n=1 Tax=Blastosporella zonata TaxID=530045 RepID=A0A386TY05_9AGAR|nr:LAGLIDADG homing endonuclease [Blastosporella zonata]AYE93107.1 LAGLIDADG homing endonuclease [Blastosporella zonata]
MGSINISGYFVHYKVRSRKDLSIIIEHFNKYPLCTSKKINFMVFTKIYELIGHKLHTDVNGFLQLASLINKLNKPLSASLTEELSILGELPDVELESPVINRNPDLKPFWISGFITGEGTFTYFTRIRKKSKNETVKDFTLVMVVSVSLDSKDGYILTSIKIYFGVGKVYQESRGITKYRITIKEEIIDKLVPHFINHPLGGNKLLQYNFWIKIVNLLLENPKRNQERDNNINILIRDLSNF